MATSDSVRESRYATAITAIVIAGFAVMLVGLTLLGVAASQRTTVELIGVLSGAPTQLDSALAHALDPWGVATLITGVALTLIAAVAKIFGRQWVRPDDRTESQARS